MSTKKNKKNDYRGQGAVLGYSVPPKKEDGTYPSGFVGRYRLEGEPLTAWVTVPGVFATPELALKAAGDAAAKVARKPKL